MKKDKTFNVLFREGDATVYVNQTPHVRIYRRKWYKPWTWRMVLGEDDIYVADADLRYVTGVSPHYWKIVEGVILPMNKGEMKKKDKILHAINKSYVIKENAAKRHMLMVTLAGFIAGIIFEILTKWSMK